MQAKEMMNAVDIYLEHSPDKYVRAHFRNHVATKSGTLSSIQSWLIARCQQDVQPLVNLDGTKQS